VAINTVDRFGIRLVPEGVAKVLGNPISAFPQEHALFEQSIAGRDSYHDWYESGLVRSLYRDAGEDLSWRYAVALSMPIIHPETNEIEGVWINIINWSYFQKLLDAVEEDLRGMQLRSGYAFMYRKDADTVIGHKYRSNRAMQGTAGRLEAVPSNLYGTSVTRDHHLTKLRDAILRKERTFAYEFPKGNSKRSGIAPISDTSFGWIVGVGIDDADIFRPIAALKWWLIGTTSVLAVLVVTFTYLIGHGITVPLRNLIETAQTIARGDLNRRVSVQASDEVGVLGTAFNDMARALSARELELQDLNRNLEEMVRRRTQELEDSHEDLKKAYEDLQSTQDQLVQTEKMASLGQLVAGIAHEIKNPLNFIYGNTSFLTEYVRKLEMLLDSFDRLPSIAPEDRSRIDALKGEVNYDFIKEDLAVLIDNFAEGARRINAIVSDLRAFSRMDTDVLSEVDLHGSLDMSLNLLRNQYKNRIEVHREYGAIPRIRGYSGKLNQVFMNLLANAFAAIQDNGDVWIRTRTAGGAVEIEIEDNGIGIPRENLKRIFEPFFTTKGVGHGTGLGLSISYGIIEQHRGRILVSSTLQKGSVFTVRLPLEQEQAAG
jgi:signal transduction histidine kinase